MVSLESDERNLEWVTPAVLVFVGSYLFIDYVVFRFAGTPLAFEQEALVALVLALLVAVAYVVRR